MPQAKGGSSLDGGDGVIPNVEVYERPAAAPESTPSWRPATGPERDVLPGQSCTIDRICTWAMKFSQRQELWDWLICEATCIEPNVTSVLVEIIRLVVLRPSVKCAPFTMSDSSIDQSKPLTKFTRWYRSPLFNVILIGLISFTQPGVWNALNST